MGLYFRSFPVPKSIGTCEGNFSTRAWRVEYEKFKPLKYSHTLYFHHAVPEV